MLHLTLTGYYAGRPLCDCDKSKALANGDEFVHAMYYRGEEDSEQLCDVCRDVWFEDAGDDE